MRTLAPFVKNALVVGLGIQYREYLISCKRVDKGVKHSSCLRNIIDTDCSYRYSEISEDKIRQEMVPGNRIGAGKRAKFSFEPLLKLHSTRNAPQRLLVMLLSFGRSD